jgi:hypothetical protein
MASPGTDGLTEPTTDRSPEVLARLVLRCRDLANTLEASLGRLPSRADTPFLHSQLDDVIKRLHSALRPLSREEAPAERSAGFLRRLRRPAPERKCEPRYDLEGSAWTIPVTDLVGFLSHSGKSGLLWVTAAEETFVLEFARGALVHATSNAPPAEFRLGEILLSEKMVEPSELAQLLEHAKSADDLLGSYLLRTGRLKHSDVQRALAIQVQQLFHRLMEAENALYRFQEGAQLLRSQGLEVNITQLLLESARKKDEERQKAASQLQAIMEDLTALDGGGGSAPAASEKEPAAALPTPAQESESSLPLEARSDVALASDASKPS